MQYKNIAMMVAVVGLAALTGCDQTKELDGRLEQSASDTKRAPDSVKSAFEAEDFMGDKIGVLVIPKVESDAAVEIRAKVSGLDPKSVAPRTSGFTVYVASPESKTGSAFLIVEEVYHLRTDKIFVTKSYYYGDGFLSSDIAQVSQKSWLCEHAASPGELANLETIAEAVTAGSGHRAAYEAIQAGGSLGKGCYREEADYGKDGAWVLGPQKIENNVFIELKRLDGVGNRFSTRFIEKP